MLLKKQRMDQEMNVFLENIKTLAFEKHLEVELIENSAKLGRNMSESGKLSLNTYLKLIYI